MNGLKLKLENAFHKLFSKKSKSTYFRDVTSDWKRVIMLFVVAFLAIGGVSLYFFIKLNSGEVFTEGKIDSVTKEIISTKQLNDMNAYYDKLTEKNEAGSASTTIPIDPSR